MSEWSDNYQAEGLLDEPYVAFDDYNLYLWVGGIRFWKDAYSAFNNPELLARQTGLPMFKARRDYRRRLSWKWERIK